MKKLCKNTYGFTLVELLVVMGVFVIVIMIAGSSFEMIMKYSSKLIRTEESNIEGVVGLEMLRHDLSVAGYGLPDSFDPNNSAPRFAEASVAPASNYNDGQGTSADANIPRSFAGGNNLTSVATTDADGFTFNIIGGTDYLALKGTSLGKSISSQKWTYSLYSSTPKSPKMWNSNADNIPTGAGVIMLKRIFSESGYRNQLVANGTTISIAYDPLGFSGNFAPLTPYDMNYIYGVTDSGVAPIMPFNRSDYFVARPPNANISSVCSDATDSGGKPLVGILYKAVVKQSTIGLGAPGTLIYTPILDCVADMQVVLGWDVNGDGVLDTWSNMPDATGNITAVNGLGTFAQVTALLTADGIRNGLKLFKIFVLAQSGKRDTQYISPSTINIGELTALTRQYQIPNGSTMLNYRWKLYQIVVRPKNLTVNQ